MEILGITGYLLAGAAFFIFLLLLVAAKVNTFAGKLILTVSLLILSSSLASAWQIKFSMPLKLVLVIENIKYLVMASLVLSTYFGLGNVSSFFSHRQTRKYLLALIVISLFCWFASYASIQSGNYIFVLFLILSISIIVMIEQLYRNADAKAKWALWPLTIALGTSTVFDFVIFAQATMVNQLDFSFWYARGFAITIGMPLLLVSARRMKQWSVDVFVSREVVFFSSMLMISGGYLVLLSFAGYAINFIGGQWSDVISIAFLVLGITVLVALLITERLRREVKVFITKHFYANKYDYRIEWLKSIEQLQLRSGKDCFQTATEIICTSINSDKGALIKVADKNQYKCMYQKDFTFDSAMSSVLKNVERFYEKNAWIIDVREYTFVEDSYPELELNIDYCKQAGIELIVPIVDGNELYGMFLLSLPSTRGYLNWEDRDLLFAITKQLSNFLSLNEATSALAESKQFEAFHRMSAFLVHDLKNIQAQLGLINSNAKRHRDNPAFIDDVFETIESATARLDKVLTQLRNKQVIESSKSQVDLNNMIEKVIAQRNVNKPSVESEIEGKLSLHIEESELASVLNHLVQNAQEATSDEGWVRIKASKDESVIRLAVLDNGSGMSEDFIKHRLFKPFDTTKGNAGMGIGVYEAKQFVESQGGSIQVTSFEGEGSIFQITLPCD